MGLNSSSRLPLLQITIIAFGLLLTNNPSLGQSQENSRRMQLIVPQASAIVPYQQQIDRLLNLIRQRLLLQNDVARWKWNHNSAIEAPEREQVLLAQLREQASAYGLAPDAVVVFFQWQIFAGKLLQIDDFQIWQKEGIQFFDNVPDLNQTLRPSLDKLSPEILSALAALSPALSCSTSQQLIQSRAQVILHGDDINQTVRRIAIAPLIELKGSSCPDVSRISRESVRKR
jgi:chorismate mutase